MKTIQSIFESLLFNFFPADLAAHLIVMIKSIFPLVGIVMVRIFLYITLGVQKLGDVLYPKLREAENDERLYRSLRF